MNELKILLMRQALGLGSNKIADTNGYSFVGDEGSVFRLLWEELVKEKLAHKEQIDLDEDTTLVNFSVSINGLPIVLKEDESVSEDTHMDMLILEASSRGVLSDTSDHYH